jgi:ERCC4-type nuclease
VVYLDDRIGSKELERYFSPYDVPVESTRLEFGDACWVGKGPEGDCMIGLERKRITDMVQSMRERRLSGKQLPGLMTTYDFNYLVVEGYFRPGNRGELEERRGKGIWRSMGLSYRELDNHLSTLELKCGVIVRRTATPQETVALIVNLFKWWEKDWKKHKSHQQIYAPVPTSLCSIGSRKAHFRSPEEEIRRLYGEDAVLVWKMAAQLPGLDSKAELVARHFRTLRKFTRAKADDWIKIDGIGKKLATNYAERFNR